MLGRCAAATGIVLLAGLVILGLASRPPRTASGTPAPAIGHPAPGFTLNDINGRATALDSYRGHVVLINFFATWCIPCSHEMPAINHLYHSNHSGLTVLAIDKQEPVSDVRKYISSKSVDFVALMDPSADVWRRYHVNIQPVSFWLDRGGTVRAIDYGAMAPAQMRRELRHILRV